MKVLGRTLQKLSKSNNRTRMTNQLSRDEFKLWSKRAVGGANPIKVGQSRQSNINVKAKKIWQNVKNFLGFRKKLNPKSFSNGKPTPQVPFVASSRSVELSNRYLNKNILTETEVITDGFRDAGRGVAFDKWGKAISGHREIITVDMKCDTYLQKAIEYTKTSTQGMNEKEKAKFIYNLIQDISGDVVKSEARSSKMVKLYKNQEILLGKVFEKEAATCRHKSLLFKILADQVGLKTKMIRGNYMDMNGVGGHAWNELILSDGKKYLYDLQNSIIIDLKKGNIKNKPFAYLDFNNRNFY